MNLLSTPSPEPVHFSWRTFRVFNQLYAPLIVGNPGNRFKQVRRWAKGGTLFGRSRASVPGRGKTVHRIPYPFLFQWFLCTAQAKKPCPACIGGWRQAGQSYAPQCGRTNCAIGSKACGGSLPT